MLAFHLGFATWWLPMLVMTLVWVDMQLFAGVLNYATGLTVTNKNYDFIGQPLYITARAHSSLDYEFTVMGLPAQVWED